jgi:predicted ATPase with chaperone activity
VGSTGYADWGILSRVPDRRSWIEGVEVQQKVMSKNARVAFVIEEEMDEMFERLAAKLSKSKSSFMRELVIKELMGQGLLTEQSMARMLANA